MENQEEAIERQEPPQLIVTEEMRSYIYDIAKWAGFLAIVGFVFAGITIVGAFTLSAAMNTDPNAAKMLGSMGNIGGMAFTIICLVLAFAIFYPSLLLFKYSTKAKNGILYSEQESLDEAFSKLKSLFKFWGIIMIVYIGLYLLMIISTVMSGVAVQG